MEKLSFRAENQFRYNLNIWCQALYTIKSWIGWIQEKIKWKNHTSEQKILFDITSTDVKHCRMWLISNNYIIYLTLRELQNWVDFCQIKIQNRFVFFSKKLKLGWYVKMWAAHPITPHIGAPPARLFLSSKQMKANP